MKLPHNTAAIAAPVVVVAVLCAESIADVAVALVPTWAFALGGAVVACGLTAYAWRLLS